jgi:peroxiredoxin
VVSAPRLGAPAPALDLPAADGTGPRSLEQFRGRPVLVSFLGPAHCTFCRAHLIRAIQHRQDFERMGAEVVLVAYHDPELLTSKMMHDLEVPFTLLLDPAREAYRRWGLDRATWRNAIVPGLFVAAAKSLFSREPSLGSTPGPVQLGGDFVVGRDGRLAFVNVMRSFHDRAPMPAVLAALRDL